MAETSVALTKYIPFPPTGEMPPSCTPNTKYKTKVKQVLRDIMKHQRIERRIQQFHRWESIRSDTK